MNRMDFVFIGVSVSIRCEFSKEQCSWGICLYSAVVEVVEIQLYAH